MRLNKFLISTFVVPCLGFSSLATLLLTSTVHAEELPDKAVIRVGGYVVNSADTDIRINPSGSVLGTNINYSRDLGGEDDRSELIVTGYYRFNNHHRLDFGWYNIDRDGYRVLDVDITIGDETFVANSEVVSNLVVDIYKASYTYSFYHNEKVELSVSAGIHFMDYEYLVETTDGAQREQSDFLAPLPVFGFLMNYHITSKWKTYVEAELFYIELENKYEGSWLDFRAGTEYRVIKNLGVGLSLNRFSIDAEVDDDNFRGNVKDVYKGYSFYAAYYF